MIALRALAALTLLVTPVLAAPTEAEQRLQTAVNEVLAIADRSSSPAALAKGLRPVLDRYVSFDVMTRRAVGPGWRQFAPAQQADAVDLFTSLVIRSYSARFTPGEKATTRFRAATETAPGRVEIPTTLVYQGKSYEVVYRLEQAAGWKITDIVGEGVSLVANYRTQFDAQFKKGGADAVVASLRQAVARQP